MDEGTAVARLKRGDIGGLEYLVRAHQGRAVGAAYLIVRDWSLAEDVVQSAFIRVYERIAQFDETRAFAPWFLRIVTNDAVKLAQRAWRHPSLDVAGAGSDNEVDSLLDRLPDTDPGPAEQLDRAESRDAVWSALEALSPMQRQAIVLRYYLDLTEVQVADRLGIAPGTAKWHLHEARKRLQRMLTGWWSGQVSPAGVASDPSESDRAQGGGNR